MTRGWSTYDERTIARLKAEGRGAGLGSAYKPWLTVRDTSSHGLSTRAKGWKTERTHHVLSNHELRYLYCLEWSPVVTDIREQFPLPQEDTLRIAERLGIPHPCHITTKHPVVMTTDFLITCARQGASSEEARTVKPSTELASRRVLEKLEIERVYWTEQGVSWGIVTELDYSLALAQNVELVHEPRRYSSYMPLTPEELDDVATLLTEDVTHHTAVPLRRITSHCDRTLGLEPGASLTVAYYLIATRQWLVDMYTPIHPVQPLLVRGAQLYT